MKQPRYLDKDGKRDWIDDYAANNSMERFNGAMAFTIGKYRRRFGKKDPEEMELYKIEDYTKRWIDALVEIYVLDYFEAKQLVILELEQITALASEE